MNNNQKEWLITLSPAAFANITEPVKNQDNVTVQVPIAEKYAKQIASQEEAMQAEQKKEHALQRAFARIDDLREQLQKAQEKGTLSFKEKTNVNGEMVKEIPFEDFDWEQDKSNLTKESLAKLDEISHLAGQLHNITETLQIEGVSDDDITERLYSTIVSEKLFPVTLIPEVYNKTQKMIKATNDQFMSDAEDAQKIDDRGDAIVSGVFDTLSLGADIASSAFQIQFAKSERLSSDSDELQLKEGITKITKLSLELTQLTYETLKKKGSIAAFCADALDKIADTVGAALFIGYGDNEKFLQSIVVYSIKAGSAVAEAAKECQDLDSPIETVLNILKKSCMLALDGALQVENYKDPDNDLSDPKKEIALIKAGVDGALAAAIETCKAYNARDEAGWTAFLLAVGTSLANVGKNIGAQVQAHAVGKQSEKTEQEKEAFEEAGDSQKAKEKDQTFVEEESRAEELGEMAGENNSVALPTKEKEKAKFSDDEILKLEALRKQIEENRMVSEMMPAENDFEAENRVFKEQLALLNPDLQTGSDKELESLEQMAKELVQTKAMMEQLCSIGKMGTTAASIAVEAIGVGTTAITLFQKGAQAIKRWQEWGNWQRGYDFSLKSPNPYVSSIMSLMNEQKWLFTKEATECALLTVRLIGEALSVSPLAPAGLITKAVASIAETSTSLAFKFHDQNTVRSAWKQTLKALKNPGMIRLNLYVRSLNPSLAKYTLVYGAKEANDPFAINALNELGITDDLLEQESAKADVVLKYLQARFSDDREVMFHIPPKSNWVKKVGAVNFSSSRWALIISLAKQHHPDVNAEQDEITGLLEECQTLKKEYIQSAPDAVDQITADKFSKQMESTLKSSHAIVMNYKLKLEELKTKFGSWAATVDGKPIDENKIITDQYIGYINGHIDSLSSVMNEIDKKRVLLGLPLEESQRRE